MLPSTRTRAAVVAVVTLLGSLLLAVAPTGSAEASSSTQVVTGVIKFPQGDHPKVQLLWFDRNWSYLGKKAAGGGSYAVNLAPGTYHLQFVDQRPSYKIEKYAPTDIQVTVGTGPTLRDVKMKRGGYVTGTVRTGDGKPAKNARVVAANRAEQSFETTANAKGQFAVGGLPQGKYSMFTWDKSKRWVGKSAWAGAVKPRTGQNVDIKLKKRAGALRVLLYTPSGSLTGKTSVTITSKATGQWWTATAKGGSAVFQGLYPGGYKLEFAGLGVWLPRTGSVASGKVRSNQTDIGKFKISQRGGWITGTAVDSGAPAYPIKNAQVLLYDQAGTKLDETTSSTTGAFTLDGQLRTQSGMTVVVNPGPASGGWTQGAAWCHFESTSVPSVSVAQSKQTALGAVPVTRTPVAPDAGVQCAS